MSLTSPDSGAARTAAEINAAIRVLTAGQTVWSREDLERLRALQAEWRQAVAREAALAA